MKPPKVWTPPAEFPNPSITGTVRRVLTFPADPEIIGIVDGVLSELTFSARWADEPDTVGAEAAARYFTVMLEKYWSSRPMMIGLIVFAPAGMPTNDILMCDGATYNRVDYPELYALNLEWGGFLPYTDDTFNVPNLMYKFPYMTDEYGMEGGQSAVTLSEAEMPVHTHNTTPHTHSEVIAVPSIMTIGAGAPAPTAVPGVGVTGLSGVTVLSAGSSQPHDNMPPFVGLWVGIIAR